MSNRIEVENISSWLLPEGLGSSTINGTENNLQSEGSLLESSPSLTDEDRCLLKKSLGDYAAERVVGISPELVTRDLNDAQFLGGVCALSTREGKLLRKRLIEDPVSGEELFVTEGLDELSDVVTAVQVFEAIGLTSNDSAIVLEDLFWTERVTQFLAERGLKPDDVVEDAGSIVRSRNRQTFEAVKRLRAEVTGESRNIRYFTDDLVIDGLKTGTDAMLEKLGLQNDDPTDYKYVYAGMYSYVWRDVLIGAGIVDPEQLAVIYEPTKHIGQEDGPGKKISRFKSGIVQEQPYMQPGSLSENVGFIAFVEPRDPNGRLFRDNVPTALMPNSRNYQNFDFSRFPIVPKKANGLPTISEFPFSDKLSSTALGKNPAFLWGLTYPPTEKSLELMQYMVRVSRGRRETVGAAMKNPAWYSTEAPGMTKQQLSAAVTAQYSREMTVLAEGLVTELQRVTNLMFGDNDATN